MIFARLDNKSLSFFDDKQLLAEGGFGDFIIAFLDAGLEAALELVDAIVANVITEEFEKSDHATIEEILATHLSDVHPLFFMYHKLEFTVLRRLFSARLVSYYLSVKEMPTLNNFRAHYLGLPYRYNNYFLEDSEVRLLFALLKKKRLLSTGNADKQQLLMLDNEVVYLAERVRSADKNFAGAENECNDLLERLIKLQQDLLELLYAVFDIEHDDYKHMPAIKRYYIYSLLKENGALFRHEEHKRRIVIETTKEELPRDQAAGSSAKPTSPEEIEELLLGGVALWIEEYPLKSVEEAISLEIESMLLNETRVKYCYNCNKLFIPSIRKDERYCLRLFDGEHTCRQLGYELKIKSDQIMQSYRTAYKTQHARMQRSRHIEGYRENVYEPWAKAAKAKLGMVRTGKLKKDEYLGWLKESTGVDKKK